MLRFLLTITLAFAGLTAPAQADVVLFSTGFEPPEYELGPLDGQDGWLQDIGPPENITVQSDVVRSGAQAVRILATGTPNFTRALHFIDYDTDSNASQLVRFATALRIQEAGVDSEYRVVAFSDSGILSELVVQPGGMISLLDVGGQVDTGVVIDYDVWHDVVLDYDFAAQTYDAFLDGVQLGNDRPFVLSDVFLAIGFEVLAMGVGTDSAFIDDVSVTLVVPAVPEPSAAALVLLAFGAAAMAGRRRIRR